MGLCSLARSGIVVAVVETFLSFSSSLESDLNLRVAGAEFVNLEIPMNEVCTEMGEREDVLSSGIFMYLSLQVLISLTK